MVDRTMKGLYPILSMPFTDDGMIDEEDLRREVDFCISKGSDGLGIAMASEITKLSEDERDLATKTVVAQTNGRAKIVVNTGAPSTSLALTYSTRAVELGADAVMVIPPVGISSEATRSYYREIAKAVPVPIFIQDIMFSPVPPGLAAQISEDSENACYAKVETHPTPPRVTEAVDKAKGKLIVFGGAGGDFLIEELARGSVGTMPGAAFPEAFRRALDLHFSGDREGAAKEFWEYSALLRNLGQPQLQSSLTKEVLRLRGVFKTNNVRRPHNIPDPYALKEIANLVDELELGQFHA